MQENNWKPPISLWLIFLAAFLLSMFLIMQEYVSFSYSREDGGPFEWMFTLVSTFSAFLLWPLLSPLIFRLSHTFTQGKPLSAAKITAHLLISIAIAFCHRVLASLVLFTFYLAVSGEWYGRLNNHTYSAIFINIFSSVIIYWVLVGVFLAIDYRKKFQQKQVELVRMENELNTAQLSALKMQLHPHFLFNTLHTISSLMDENIERAQKMLAQIGFLLRALLEQEQKHTTTLKEEMRYIRSYLDIEQTRFRDRLEIQYEIAKETLAAQVPNLILQPLVENAIKHGFSKRTDCGTIRVGSRRVKDRLELVVEDDGRGSRDTSVLIDNSGIGLKNVQNRLWQLYKDESVLELVSPNGKGFVARISMPFETETRFDSGHAGKTGSFGSAPGLP